LFDQGIDRVAVENVTAPVFDLLPAVRSDVKGPARHADHPLHLGHALERGEERLADLARGPGDGYGQALVRAGHLTPRQPRPAALPLDLADALLPRTALDV